MNAKVMPKDNSRLKQLLSRTEPPLHVRARRCRILVDQLCRRPPGRFDQVEVALEIREAQKRLAALALAEEFAGAAQLEIEPGDLEAVGIFVNRLEAGARSVRKRAA